MLLKLVSQTYTFDDAMSFFTAGFILGMALVAWVVLRIIRKKWNLK